MSFRSVREKNGLSASYSEFSKYDTPFAYAALEDFSGGMMMGEIQEGKNASEIFNMEPVGGALFSTCAPAAAFSPPLAQGPVRFSCCLDGIWLFRKGNTLYAMRDGSLSVVGTAGQFTSEKTTAYPYAGGFYIVDGDMLYFLDREWNLTPVEPYIPTCYTDVSADGSVKTESEKPNLFCQYIEIVLAAEGSSTRKIPPEIAFDPSYIRIWDLAGAELGDPDFNFENGEILFFGVYSKQFRVRLKLAASDDPEKLSDTSLGILRDAVACPEKMYPLRSFAGGGFLTYGGENGMWISLLMPDPVNGFRYLTEDNIIRMNYGETITSIAEYSDGYLVFSAGTVKNMTVSTGEGETPVFEFRQFKNDFGSDMPGSVCGFDDKILFANSEGGVFYINKFGIEERDVSRHISAGIEKGVHGFFSHTAEEYAAASAVCAFGKYMLTVGDITYIWDYTAKLPASTQSHEDERKMVWTLCDSIKPSSYLVQRMRKLYYVDRTTDEIWYLSGWTSDSDAVHPRVSTAESDFGFGAEKTILGLSVRYRSSDTVTLKLSFDGVLSPYEYHLPAAGAFCTVWLRTHSHRFVKCAAVLCSEHSFALERLCFRYLPAKT